MGLFLSCTFTGERVKELKIGVLKNGSGPRMGTSRFMKKKKKVLVVENDIPTAMMMTSLLTQAGFDVLVATKGKKGMEIAHEQRFDLIILETDLPGANGFEICADLKERHISHRTPIVLISSEPEEEYEARLLGAADFIQQPFKADDFVSRIQSVLEETASA
jgi:two-component system alkaline phosphatase synthesis response regulator PhoP